VGIFIVEFSRDGLWAISHGKAASLLAVERLLFTYPCETMAAMLTRFEQFESQLAKRGWTTGRCSSAH
jgi:hypothetical protein